MYIVGIPGTIDDVLAWSVWLGLAKWGPWNFLGVLVGIGLAFYATSPLFVKSKPAQGKLTLSERDWIGSILS